MSSVADGKYLTPPQIAEILGVAHEKILQFIRTGELRAIDLSSKRGHRPRWHVSRDDLEDFLNRRAAKPLPPSRRRKRRRRDDDFTKYF
jgi:excisionase family DNA binding protein